ncbi:unnamed protein product [Prorocentrum cordatum]|uniref:PDZ domain-containing protein n=1 Tax=Prorocentrum cordatum TaxID=2364126 RepID=A0ABN9SNI6_9DINO|nr:unnamed protein product [Polarella glacialis]
MMPAAATDKVWAMNAQTVPPGYGTGHLAAWLRSKEGKDKDLLDLDSDSPSGVAVGDWFTKHVDVIGAPREERAPDVSARHWRAQAEEQLAEHARSPSSSSWALSDGPRRRCSEPHEPLPFQIGHAASAGQLLGSTATGRAGGPPQERRSRPAPRSACCSGGCLRAFGRLFGSSGHGSATPSQSAPKFSDPQSALIIFDWDDTLLPTTLLSRYWNDDMSLSADFPDADALTAHAHLVGFVLRTARRIARVAIVTNSMSPWVLSSGQRFLPGLDVEALLKELEIPVYYARRHVESILPEVRKTGEFSYEVEIDRRQGGRVGVDITTERGNPDGPLTITRLEDGGLMAEWNAAHRQSELQVRPMDRIETVNGFRDQLKQRCRQAELLRLSMVRDLLEPDAFVEAKRRDMDACLELFYPSCAWHRNVVSIGDSVAEQQALKQALHQCSSEPRATPEGATGPRPLCKTVNLLDRPTLEQLSSELRLLMVWLGHIVDYGEDFDLRIGMDGLDSLERVLLKT